jgi:transposase-like protein
MLIALHKNARTTPAVRQEIATSTDPASALARRFGVTEATVYKWKSRSSFGDASHTAHRLQTTLTGAQERVVVELRRTLLLPLDDLLAVTREFLCEDVSRSGLDRCLRRHGVGNLHALKPGTPAQPHKAFKSYEPGYLHMDVKYLPQMSDESRRRYLFVAIDRATRWVFVAVKANKSAASARSFLNALHKACPIRIVKLLTDNGKEFTDRLFASRERAPSGKHEFDQLCTALGHRASPDQAQDAANQRHGRALQRSHCRCAQDASLQQRIGPGADIDALCGLVQPSIASVRLEKQNAHSGDEGLVRFPSTAVSQASL